MNTQHIDATSPPVMMSSPESTSIATTAVQLSKTRAKIEKSMPGPKMGNRPADFDERVVRMAPTFKKWVTLEDGQKLRYACRDFIKGKGNDEERLMRRIMIARRNNLRDHELLKKARSRVSPNSNTNGEDASDTNILEKVKSESDDSSGMKNKANDADGSLLGPLIRKRPKTTNGLTDLQVKLEMDELAVESTRSYKAWLSLEDGVEFTYNQTYVKGKEGHDWLLKKNIWRRMRYRRQNKQMVDKLKGKLEDRTDETLFQNMDYLNQSETNQPFHDDNNNSHEDHPNTIKTEESPITNETNNDPSPSSSSAMDAAAAAAASVGVAGPIDLVNNAIVEAAVAAAVSYVKDMPKEDDTDMSNQNPTEMIVPNATVSSHLNSLEVPQVVDGAEIPLKLEEAKTISMV